MALADAVSSAVACWPLGEASGTRVDSVGANDLTDNNTVTSATGMFGDAANFEFDNNEYLSITDNTDLSTGDVDFMLRCWVKFQSFGENRCVIGKANGTNFEYDISFRNGNSKLQFRVATGAGLAGFASVESAVTLSTDTWYLIHAWHDSVANVIAIAVNNETAVTQSHSGGVYNGTDPFQLGRQGFDATFDGVMDDVVVLKNYILDATERAEDYNSGTGVAFADWAGAGGATTPKAWFGKMFAGCFGGAI